MRASRIPGFLAISAIAVSQSIAEHVPLARRLVGGASTLPMDVAHGGTDLAQENGRRSEVLGFLAQPYARRIGSAPTRLVCLQTGIPALWPGQARGQNGDGDRAS